MNSLSDIGAYRSNIAVALPYSFSAYVNGLALYDQSEGRDTDLDLSREVVDANNYFYQGIPFPVIPEGQLYSVQALSTVTGTVSAPAYSYLTSITGYQRYEEAQTPPTGFNIRVYDKGAKTDLFYNKFSRDCSAVGIGRGSLSGGGLQFRNTRNGIGPRWMISPMIMLPPGSLQVEITNLIPIDSLIQVIFNFAIPLNKQNTNLKAVTKGQ